MNVNHIIGFTSNRLEYTSQSQPAETALVKYREIVDKNLRVLKDLSSGYKLCYRDDNATLDLDYANGAIRTGLSYVNYLPLVSSGWNRDITSLAQVIDQVKDNTLENVQQEIKLLDQNKKLLEQLKKKFDPISEQLDQEWKELKELDFVTAPIYALQHDLVKKSQLKKKY